METDISLLDYGIQKKNSAFRNLDEKEREKKILNLLNYGFVWNPYYEEFENRFWSITSSTDILSLESSQIKDQINLIRKTPKSFEEVEKGIYWDQSNRLLRRIDLWAATYSIIFGPLIWILGISLIILSNFAVLSSILLITGTILTYYWITYQMLYLKIATRAEQSPIMQKNERLFRLLRILSIGATLYLIMTYNETPYSYLLIGSGLVLTFFANYCISKSLVSNWWCFNGFHLLEKYYNKFGHSK